MLIIGKRSSFVMADIFKSGSYEIILKRIRDIPSLPEVVNRIVEIMSKPNTPASEIAQLISYDPGLTSKVLRMTNSAAYGFQRQISSVQHGIMILGFNTVRGLVLSASIFKMFEGQSEAKGLSHKAFWEHSMATAIVSRSVAEELKLPDMDDAFSAGMLHDIGKIVLDVYFKKYYVYVLNKARKTRVPFHGVPFIMVEQDVLETDHSEIGAFLANKWKLPITITEVIQFHHAPQKAETCQSLVYVVAFANELVRVHFLNHGIFKRELFSQSVLEYLNLEDEQIRALQSRVKEELDCIDELLSSLSGTS